MILGKRRDQNIGEENLGRDVLSVQQRRYNEAQIGPLRSERCQLLRRRSLSKLKLDLGMTLPKVLKDARQEIVSGACTHESQPQRANEPLSCTLRDLNRTVRLGYRSACFLQEDEPSLSKPRYAVRALQEPSADLRFDLPDRGRQWRLCHVQALRRATEAELLSHGYELAELAQFEQVDTR